MGILDTLESAKDSLDSVREFLAETLWRLESARDSLHLESARDSLECARHYWSVLETRWKVVESIGSTRDFGDY